MFNACKLQILVARRVKFKLGNLCAFHCFEWNFSLEEFSIKQIWVTLLISGIFVAAFLGRTLCHVIGHRKLSRCRWGKIWSHASDARYSASKCQKRTYNFILSTITHFTMVELGWFLDQCVLHVQTHRMTCLYDVFVPVKKFLETNFFVNFYHYIPRVPPLGQKVQKKFFWTFFIFCIIFARLHA